MNLMESVRIALRSLAANKLRSSLTMLGIIIGVVAVIAVMGGGGSWRVGGDQTARSDSMGTNLLFVSPGSNQQQRRALGARLGADADLRGCRWL